MKFLKRTLGHFKKQPVSKHIYKQNLLRLVSLYLLRKVYSGLDMESVEKLIIKFYV